MINFEQLIFREHSDITKLHSVLSHCRAGKNIHKWKNSDVRALKYPENSLQINKCQKQAEAEDVPSSSLVEVGIEFDVGVEVQVGVEVGVEVGGEVGGKVEVGVEVFDLQIKSNHPLRVKSYFFSQLGWVGGWRFED